MFTSNCVKLKMAPGLYRRFLIDKQLLIGRNPKSDVVLQDISVSGHHVTIWQEKNEYWVRDENSTNGTLLNGVAVKKSLRLADKDILYVGNIQLRVSLPQEQEKIIELDLAKAPAFFAQEDKLLKIWKEIVERSKKVEGLSLKGSLQKEKDRIVVILQSEEHKAQWWNFIFDQDTGKPNIDIEHQNFCIEYEEKQNILCLVKDIEQEVDKNKFLSCRYFLSMPATGVYPLDIAISDKEIDFDNYDRSKIDSNESLKITPVFPGCICNPSSVEIEHQRKNIVERFWITPLTSFDGEAELKLTYKGKHGYIKLPFYSKPRRKIFSLLLASLWVPLLIFLLNLIDFSVNPNISGILFGLLSIVNKFGGINFIALLLGLATLSSAGTFYYLWRPKTSAMCRKLESIF